MKSHARVAVIGGGVTGCSVLYHLAKAGWSDVVLLERSELTAGSTWHAAGGTSALTASANMSFLHKYSYELYPKLEAETDQSCGFHPVGRLALARTASRLEELKILKSKARRVGLDPVMLTDAEVKGLREYLLAGGFLVVDDFWGTREWQVFESEIVRVLPEYPIIDLPLDHPIFNTVYKIEEIIQVPSLYNAQGGPTWQRDGYVPAAKGIFDDKGRLMVVINWNTDLGDAWEWAERPEYPLMYSAFAVEMGINFIVYAMSH